MRIALLEDDLDQANLVESWIRQAGHDCTTFVKGKSLIRELNKETFDLLILDWMLPDIDGIDVLKWVRANVDFPLPVLFVTAKDSEEDVVTALNAGADDYMSKPIKKGELLARLNALSRRFYTQNPDEGEIKFGIYTIYPANNAILIENEAVELTQKEFDLAYFLFKNAGRVISRGHMLESVWGSSSDLNTRTVDTHVSRIRTKMHLKGTKGWYLRSVYQHGYRLEKVEENILHLQQADADIAESENANSSELGSGNITSI